MVRWEPRDDVLPDGVAALRERLGRRPLVAHCRHLSSQSPYVDEFAMWIDGDRAHPQDAELYERLLDQAVAWGVEVFEHDWLIECFLGVRGLRAPGRAAAWQEGIDAGLGARDLHAQWCMASPADFAQASRLRNVTSIRTSGDHGYLVGPGGAVGVVPAHQRDGARARAVAVQGRVPLGARRPSTREVEALLAGAVGRARSGVGDRIGEADVDLIRRTCRADGVLVRPDVPIAAIDRRAVRPRRCGRASCSSAARTRSTRPVVGDTWSRATSDPSKQPRNAHGVAFDGARRGPSRRPNGSRSSTGDADAST